MLIFPPCSMRECFVCRQFSPGKEAFPILKQRMSFFRLSLRRFQLRPFFCSLLKTGIISSLTGSFECFAISFSLGLRIVMYPEKTYCLLQEMRAVSWEGCFSDFYPTVADQGFIFLKFLCQISKPSELCSQLEVTIRNRAGNDDNQRSGNSLSVKNVFPEL